VLNLFIFEESLDPKQIQMNCFFSCFFSEVCQASGCLVDTLLLYVLEELWPGIDVLVTWEATMSYRHSSPLSWKNCGLV